jgi:hypothetical protein
MVSSSSVSRRGDRLLQLDSPEEEVLEGQQRKQAAVAYPSHGDDTSGGESVEPVVVGRRHDDQQDEAGIEDAQEHEEELAELGHALLAGGETAAEETRVVDEHGSDAERVTEMQGRERRELVEELVTGVDGLGILASNCVEESESLGEEARGHAWVRGEGDEAQQIREGHHATSGGELSMGRCGIVIPREKAMAQGGLVWFEEKIGIRRLGL